MTIKTDTIILAVAVVGAVLAARYAAGKLVDLGGAVADGVAATVPYINPADSHNVINSGVSAIGGAVTGQSDWSLGTQIYDWLH
jgi:hypothetical protein